MLLTASWFLLFFIFGGPVANANRFSPPGAVAESKGMCMQMPHYKRAPSPEPDLLAEECGEWSDLSCCTHQQTTGYKDDRRFFGFNMAHCGEPLPPACMDIMQKEFCLARCSPYLGPWMMKTTSKKFPEGVFGMPLCQSDCNRWFDACKTGKTCALNWARGGFNWTKGTNQCRNGMTCKPIGEIYHSAKEFCEVIWNHRWRVVPDDPDVLPNQEPKCLHIDHQDVVSQNKRVSQQFATRIHA